MVNIDFQENYLNANPPPSMDDVAAAADSISLADVMDSTMKPTTGNLNGDMDGDG